PALAVPFGPRDLGAAETARDVDPDPQRTDAHGVLHRPLHRAAERNPALELLGDRFGHQSGIELGLAHLDDVQVQFRSGHRGKLLAQRLDIRAFLADDDARPRRVDRDPAFAMRALDDHAADAGLL